MAGRPQIDIDRLAWLIQRDVLTAAFEEFGSYPVDLVHHAAEALGVSDRTIYRWLVSDAKRGNPRTAESSRPKWAMPIRAHAGIRLRDGNLTAAYDDQKDDLRVS